VKLEVDPKLGRLAPEVELVLFRVLQESPGNIHPAIGKFACRDPRSSLGYDHPHHRRLWQGHSENIAG
jgi:hypothetical protein